MEKSASFAIRRRTTLSNRFPEQRLATNLDKRNASWMVYAPYLSAQQFEDMDFFTGEFHQILDCWAVGQYEVALMAGQLTTEHEVILQNLNLDYASLAEVPDLNKPGLALFDMDSTVIRMECIDEIAKLAGVGDEVAEVTERAMQGELDFEESLRTRVSKLSGAPESILQEVRECLPLMPDLQKMMATLQAFGWKTAIASGGFTYFSEHLKDLLNLDFAQSNLLDIQEGKLTGEVIGDVVSAQTKADILQQLVDQYDIELHNTVAVGDGANDLLMMQAAGLGVAYHAKPKVEQEAQVAIRHAGLGGLICILSAQRAKQQKVSWQQTP